MHGGKKVLARYVWFRLRYKRRVWKCTQWCNMVEKKCNIKSGIHRHECITPVFPAIYEERYQFLNLELNVRIWEDVKSCLPLVDIYEGRFHMPRSNMCLNRPGFAGDSISWEDGVMKTTNRYSPEIRERVVRTLHQRGWSQAAPWAYSQLFF